MHEGTGSPIRILIANLPCLFAQMVVRTVTEQRDMVIIGEVQGNVNILRSAGKGVDVVILGAETLDPPPGICTHLLNEFPALKILVVVPHKNHAAGMWLDIRQERYAGITNESLMANIRQLSTLTPGF